ncbi:MAG: hypothetical protein PHP82_03970 [Candidatus ainarchaeum sp.]|nr:hypothetical protein [Candidatus ainarchaeum sp.]
METIMIKGIAVFSAVIAIQQWVFQHLNPFDAIFVALIVAFLISIDHDYIKYKKRSLLAKKLANSLQKNLFFFLNRSTT